MPGHFEKRVCVHFCMMSDPNSDKPAKKLARLRTLAANITSIIADEEKQNDGSLEDQAKGDDSSSTQTSTSEEQDFQRPSASG